ARRPAGDRPTPELAVELGFVGARPRSRDFRRELEAEVERLRAFLVPPAGSASEEEASEEDTAPPGHAGRAPPPPAQSRAAVSAASLRSRRAPGSSRPRAGRQSPRPRS